MRPRTQSIALTLFGFMAGAAVISAWIERRQLISLFRRGIQHWGQAGLDLGPQGFPTPNDLPLRGTIEGALKRSDLRGSALGTLGQCAKTARWIIRPEPSGPGEQRGSGRPRIIALASSAQCLASTTRLDLDQWPRSLWLTPALRG